MIASEPHEFDLVVHHNDLDGYVAAWTFWRSQVKPPQLHPVDYKDSPPDVYRRRTAILDFCFEREEMLALAEKAPLLLVLDHHDKTAQKFVGEDYSWLRIDTNRAGCRMAWDYRYPGEEPPPLVLYAEDQDMWRHRLAGTREYCAAVSTYREHGGWSMQVLEQLNNRPFEELITEGRPVLRLLNNQVEEALAHARTVEFQAGELLVRATAVNTTVHPSQVADALQETGPNDVVIAWWHNGRGYHYSLRGRTTDVCAIASELGGGGHKRASGVQRRDPISWKYLD